MIRTNVLSPKSIKIHQSSFFAIKKRFFVLRFTSGTHIFFGSHLSLSQVIITANLLCNDDEKVALDAHFEGMASS
jgi:hypothetical protein